MASRVVLLLLAFVLSFSLVQLAEMLIYGLASLLPGGFTLVLLMAGALASAFIQFFLSGFLFTMAVGMPWKRSALWTWAGIGLCNLLSAGPGAVSSDYLAAQFLTLWGLARLLASAAGAGLGCRELERREHEPWAEQGRAMLLAFFNR